MATFKSKVTPGFLGFIICHTQRIAEYKACSLCYMCHMERWGAGVETQKNVQEDFWGWGRVPFNETYAPSLSTIYDGA